MIAAAAAVGTVAGTPAQARAAGGEALPPYTFDATAQRVRGAASSSDAQPLETGRTYRDTLRKNGKVYYRVVLDGKRNTYVSVVAVPGPGGKVDYGDGFKVSIQDNSGTECGYQQMGFSSARYTRPLAAYARRTVNPDSSSCQQPGNYYVLVERTTKAGSDQSDWDVEIRHLAEPLLKKAGPTELPEAWPSATPAPLTGEPEPRQGGSGVYDAASLTQGEWRADIRPGQTLFYRVPLDWGQQLFATAELGSSAEGDDHVSNALVLSLENPALGHVDAETVGYGGKQATLALGPQRPVAHENRTSYTESTSGMRFAGWYYLSATLSPEIAEEYGDGPVPLTLRVNVLNAAKAGPGYDADPGPFAVTPDDKRSAEKGSSGAQAAEEAARGDSMRLVATAGIGTGTVLLLGLGAWTLVARRRAA
ncbi:hypothetical protein ADL06_00330 [Streptomyces sp. NRRL F-6491]|nr:hypothetical protein ADL06_00330 [Streptomyces sp. NRRL F-6491]KOX52739.1 hypothetical protein ADL08_00840 [Streptomyces sp. NRRL F-6492]